MKRPFLPFSLLPVQPVRQPRDGQPRTDHPTGSRTWIVGMVVCLCCVLVGCKKASTHDQASQEGRVVYHLIVRKVLVAPSAKVVAAVKRAVDAAKLDTVSRSTTNLDALFHVQTALQKEFKIEIEAVTHEQTRIDISALDKTDRDMGRILFDRISSNL